MQTAITILGAGMVHDPAVTERYTTAQTAFAARDARCAPGMAALTKVAVRAVDVIHVDPHDLAPVAGVLLESESPRRLFG